MADRLARGASLSDIDRRIYDEQIRLIYNQATSLVAGSTLCAVVITLFLWQHDPSQMLIYWIACIGVFSVARLWSIHAYLKADRQNRQRKLWGTLLWVGVLLSGLTWGVWPLLFYTTFSPEYLLLVSTIFAGMAAVSASSGGVYLPSFLAFGIPLLLPLSLTHLFSGRDSLALIGLLLIMFLALNIVIAIRSNRQNRALISSQLENHNLIESLAQEKRIADRAMVAKSNFLAAASHDLRQPLHAMGLFLSALRSREEDPQKMRIIDDMAKSADALNGLFNSLLDVSRLDAEIIEFNPVHVPASRVFDALRAQFEQQAIKKNVNLSIRAGDHVLYCDVILLERVLRNLLSNAVQYTGSGSISLYCDDCADGSKRITLEDTGIGIPAEFAEDVFSEYYQLNNPARDRSKGLGLGLSIVRRLCDLMDLTLQMSSEDGNGTVFRLVVPSGDGSLTLEQSLPSIRKIEHGRRVLVIDDENQVLQSMRHMLEGWGCEVLLAESARDALRLLALNGETPDIIVSDYRLAENLNGVDAVAAIRESVNADIPAIVVTGDTSPARLKEVKDTGLQLLHKPVQPNDLHESMQLLFEESDTRAANSVPFVKMASR